MPATPRRSRASLEKSATPWPAIYRRQLGHIDPPEVAEHWQRYQSTGDPAARQSLFEFYAPIVAITTLKLKRRIPSLFSEEPVDLFNDGAIGVLRFLESYVQRDYQPGFFHASCRQIVRTTMMREVLKRVRGISRRQLKKQNIIAEFRSRYVQDNGRVPEKAEVAAHLSGLFVNPNLAIDLVAEQKPFASCNREEVRDVCNSRAAGHAIDIPLLCAETVKLALKGLRGDDRKILKLLLAGHSRQEIEQRLHLKDIQRRLNGVLWEARSRADLALHLDREPMQRPATATRPGYVASVVPSRGGTNLPPQVKALGLTSLPTAKLARMDRSDAEIVALLRRGYSGRAVRAATPGSNANVRKRIGALQLALLVELSKAEPAPMRLAVG